MAKLLVSVRSAIEAEAALAGGASIIDVKEPARGSLGRAEWAVWRRVRQAIPPSVMLSVALGELNEWFTPEEVALPRGCWSGIDLRKLGLSDAGPTWFDRLRSLQARWTRETSVGPDRLVDKPGWVGVVYLDWESARAPDPSSVIRAFGELENCVGILFDTWDKSQRIVFDRTWEGYIDRVRETGRFVALAGSLDEATIRNLRPLEPEVFAVRGAACFGGDRRALIDPERVARLVEAASGVG